MPTQEERLDTLEYNLRQFKTETIKAYGDMAFEMTIIKGLTEMAIGRLAALSDATEKHFERVDICLDAMDAHLESMDQGLNQTNTRLDAMDAHLESMDQGLNQTNTRLDRVETMLTQILARLPGNS